MSKPLETFWFVEFSTDLLYLTCVKERINIRSRYLLNKTTNKTSLKNVNNLKKKNYLFKSRSLTFLFIHSQWNLKEISVNPSK